MYGTIAPGDVASRNDEKPVFTPGGLYHTHDGKTYKYVQFQQDTTAAAVGAPAYWSDQDTSYTDSIVGADLDESMTDTANDIRGVFTAVATDGYWTFIQTWGYNAAVVYGTTDVVKGTMGYASTDGVTTVFTLSGDAQTPYRPCGYFLVTTVSSELSGPFFLTIER